MLIEYHGVGHRHALQISTEDHRPLGFDLVGHQQPLPIQQCSKLRGFPARRSTQVQHPHSRPHVQKPGGGHGAGLLEVVQPRLVIGGQAGPGVGIVVIAAVCPGHGGQSKWTQLGRGVGFQLVQAQRHPPGMFCRGQKLLQFLLPQLLLQPLEKSFWKHGLSSILVG